MAGNANGYSRIDEGVQARLRSLSRDTLEQETIEAIREHRCLLAADEVVYEEWQRAKAEKSLPNDQIEKLMEDCLRRRRKTLDQQGVLSSMLDLLGFIPEVPFESEQSTPISV